MFQVRSVRGLHDSGAGRFPHQHSLALALEYQKHHRVTIAVIWDDAELPEVIRFGVYLEERPHYVEPHSQRAVPLSSYNTDVALLPTGKTQSALLASLLKRERLLFGKYWHT